MLMPGGQRTSFCDMGNGSLLWPYFATFLTPHGVPAWHEYWDGMEPPGSALSRGASLFPPVSPSPLGDCMRSSAYAAVDLISLRSCVWLVDSPSRRNAFACRVILPFTLGNILQNPQVSLDKKVSYLSWQENSINIHQEQCHSLRPRSY